MAERIFLIDREAGKRVEVHEMKPSIPGNLDSKWRRVHHDHFTPLDRFCPRSVGEGIGMGHRGLTCVVKYSQGMTEVDKQNFTIGLMEGLKGSNLFFNGEKLVSIEKYIKGELQSRREKV